MCIVGPRPVGLAGVELFRWQPLLARLVARELGCGGGSAIGAPAAWRKFRLTTLPPTISAATSAAKPPRSKPFAVVELSRVARHVKT